MDDSAQGHGLSGLRTRGDNPSNVMCQDIGDGWGGCGGDTLVSSVGG